MRKLRNKYARFIIIQWQLWATWRMELSGQTRELHVTWQIVDDDDDDGDGSDDSEEGKLF